MEIRTEKNPNIEMQTRVLSTAKAYAQWLKTDLPQQVDGLVEAEPTSYPVRVVWLVHGRKYPWSAWRLSHLFIYPTSPKRGVGVTRGWR